MALIKEFQLKLDIDIFRQRFNAIFWCSIWYFNLKDLCYDFFLPYESELCLDNFNKINSHLKMERSVGDMNSAIKEENEIQKKFFENYPQVSLNIRDSIMTNNFVSLGYLRNKKLSVTSPISFYIQTDPSDCTAISASACSVC